MPREVERNDTLPPEERSQQIAAKVAGFLYLIQMAIAVFAFSARNQLIVRGDAVQTARNIAASERLFRISLAGDLIVYAGVIALVLALYVVLKPVNPNLALLAAFWRLAETGILSVTTLNAYSALALVSGADYLRAVDTQQLQALANAFLRVYGVGFQIGFAFLGLGSALFSYLWFMSRYIPRALAAWGIFSSLMLAIFSLAIMVFPGLAAAGIVYMLPMGIYEIGLGLWLAAKGIQLPVRQVAT